jgi:hypothetical protein
MHFGEIHIKDFLKRCLQLSFTVIQNPINLHKPWNLKNPEKCFKNSTKHPNLEAKIIICCVRIFFVKSWALCRFNWAHFSLVIFSISARSSRDRISYYAQNMRKLVCVQACRINFNKWVCSFCWSQIQPFSLSLSRAQLWWAHQQPIKAPSFIIIFLWLGGEIWDGNLAIQAVIRNWPRVCKCTETEREIGRILRESTYSLTLEMKSRCSCRLCTRAAMKSAAIIINNIHHY